MLLFVSNICANPKKLSLIDLNINIVFDGNSLTYGHPSSPVQYFPTLIRDYLEDNAKSVTFNSFGINGQTLTEMLDNAPTKIDTLIDSNKINIIVVYEDINDIVNQVKTGLENYNNMKLYSESRFSAGYDYVIVITGSYMRNPYTQSGNDRMKDYFNLVEANPIGSIVCDLRKANNIGGLEGQDQNTIYYKDSVHLTNKGYEEISDYIIKQGINILFN